MGSLNMTTILLIAAAVLLAAGSLVFLWGAEAESKAIYLASQGRPYGAGGPLYGLGLLLACLGCISATLGLTRKA
jgi:hypothetical protein